ncbi:hypothetical protein O8C76_02380 [Aliarcobacter butzleri]|uniref:Uncharacterized protein n=1 Tax=Aliarcobacter butzleri TaxID=28197 RepID=A0AAW7PWD6_9BACT|nr:DNA gyrase subunit A [Aliarcobacter butzleri]MDN5069874.1 hypothetical protein [Aliarcobacter butzleri]
MLNNEIRTCISEFAINNNMSLNSELSKYDDLGAVAIDIVSTINISHIGNLFNSLTKLANKEFSPILNKTYTGIEILDYSSNLTIFDIDYEYVFVKNKKIITTFLNERYDENLVLDLLQKLEKLYALDIKKIQLKYCLKDKELFLQYQEENHKNGIYDLNISNSQMKEFKSELELAQAFIKVIDDLNEVITIIRESKNTFDAVKNLIEQYSFSNDVAIDIVNCSLFSLNSKKKAFYEKEEKTLKNKIISLNELTCKIKS